MADEANDAMKTPVTIVTGFLGGGKDDARQSHPSRTARTSDRRHRE